MLDRRRVWVFAASGLLILAGPVVADTLSEARAAAEAGQYHEAVRLYEQALGENTQLASDPAFVRSWAEAESMLAYEVGLLLHREGEFEPAIEQFIKAIGKDPENQAAHAALADAEFASARARFRAALAAADGDNLLAARDHLNRARALGGTDPAIAQALASIERPGEAFEQAILDKLAAADELAAEKQWQLASMRYAELVEVEPMLLPARAGYFKAEYFRDRSMQLAAEGTDHLANERLGPAAEALAGAVAIWPYHPDAGKKLQEVQLRVAKAVELTAQARAQLDTGDYRAAYGSAENARQQDLSSGPAQDVLREATRLLTNQLAEQGMAALADEDFVASRAKFVEAFEVSRGSRAARKGMTAWHMTRAELAKQDGRVGMALLHYMAADEYGVIPTREQANNAELILLRAADATYRLRVGGGADNQLGVSSTQLASALAGRDEQVWLSTATGDGVPSYLVNVQITDTDVALRRVDGVPAYDTLSGQSVGFNGWEKRGTITCDIAISDPGTGQIIDNWQANRWNSFTDRKQYIVGQSWQDSYWTLPGDDEVAAQLARAMAREVWPRVRDTITTHRAQAFIALAESLEQEGKTDEALEQRVMAVVLVGQLERRESMSRLREMMREHARPAGPAAD
ncbi:MAG: hypothetical protein AAGC44_11300 [Planctomycetota bacterium]